jgi:hypothetical protein
MPKHRNKSNSQKKPSGKQIQQILGSSVAQKESKTKKTQAEHDDTRDGFVFVPLTSVSLGEENEPVTVDSFDTLPDDTIVIEGETPVRLPQESRAGILIQQIVFDVATGNEANAAILFENSKIDSEFNDNLRESMRIGIITPEHIYEAVSEGIRRINSDFAHESGSKTKER